MRMKILGGAVTALAIAVTAALLTAGTALAGNDAVSGPNGEHQVVVCKYVGPLSDEVLQTGQNPIVVDEHSLLGAGFDGTFPFAFSDHQVNSLAIRWAENSHDGSISECPGTQPPVVTTVVPAVPVFTPATCDSPGSVAVPANADGVSYAGVVSADGTSETVTATPDENVQLDVTGTGYTLNEDGSASITFDLTSGTPSGGCGGGNPPPPPVTPPVTPPVAPPVAPPSTGGSTVATTTTSVAATL